MELVKRISTIQTPTGSLNVIRPVAQKLLKEGIISGDLDGVLHAGDAATVKAAVVASGVCDFCSAPGVESVIDVPDFTMPMGVGESTGGWAACGECAALVEKDDRAGLLRRSVAGLSFPKFSKVAIEDLHKRFWTGMEERKAVVETAQSVIQFVEDKLPLWAKTTVTERDKRIEAIARVSGLSRGEIEEFVAGKVVPPHVAKKLWAWRRSFGKVDPRTLADLLGQPKPPVTPAGVPHWQQALDVKFEVATMLRRFLRATSKDQWFPDAIDLGNAESIDRVVKQAAARQELKDLGYDQDLRVLPGAQTYSFSAETEAAIMEASKSFPHDAPLSGIETPNSGSGWFWFSEPLPVAASPAASDYTHGLLWSWTGGMRRYQVTLPDEYVAKLEARPDLVKALDLALAHDSRNVADGLKFDSDGVDIIGRALRQIGVTQDQIDDWTEEVTEGVPSLLFSAYVRDEKTHGNTHGKPMPSTRWFWPLTMTFHDMILYNAQSWTATYGPGTTLEHDPNIISREQTLKVIADLSLFFAQSCLWFRQTVEAKQPILVQEKGHIQRHARKRYIREHKLDAEPTVQVVALRKSARLPSDEAPADRVAGAREYHCRWIVQGHPRKQPCGPGRKDIKVIWIEAHPAGPEDKPLRTKTKVFAVVR